MEGKIVKKSYLREIVSKLNELSLIIKSKEEVILRAEYLIKRKGFIGLSGARKEFLKELKALKTVIKKEYSEVY